jgi:hypothetical protein
MPFADKAEQDELKNAYLNLEVRLTSLLLRVTALQMVVQDHGIPRSEIDARMEAVQKKWAADFAAGYSTSLTDKEKEKQEELRRLLDAYEGTKQ